MFAQQARQRGKQLWLPVLCTQPPGSLVFAPAASAARMQPNRFGISEPRQGARRRANELDVILLPLVGFDASGERLGMGGGFYDRTLAFKTRLPTRSPCLLGLAHACQQVERLPRASWDVPLDGVVTDGAVHRARRR